MSTRDTTPSLRRHHHRDHARDVIERESLLIPDPPVPWNYGRCAEAWRIGYAAALEGLSTDVDDYYTRDNFYRRCRSAFRRGVLAAECHGAAAVTGGDGTEP